MLCPHATRLKPKDLSHFQPRSLNLPHSRFGNEVTVVEMDGELDMDNMEEQLKDGSWFSCLGSGFVVGGFSVLSEFEGLGSSTERRTQGFDAESG